MERRDFLKAAGLSSGFALLAPAQALGISNEVVLELYEYGQNVEIPNGGTTKAGIVEGYVYGSPACETAKLTTKVYLNGEELWHQHTGQVRLDPGKIDVDIWQRTKFLGTWKIVVKTQEGAQAVCEFTRV